MPLAALLGYGPPDLVSIAGDEPALLPEHVAIIGVRDVDRSETSLVAKTGVRVWAMPHSAPSAKPVNAPNWRCASWPRRPTVKP